MATIARITQAAPGYPRVLKWSDYKIVTDSPEPPFEASTHTSYKVTQWAFTLGAAPGEKHGGLYVDPLRVFTSFEPDSWAVKAAQTKPWLLTHEQGHLDITGLIARELAKRVLDLRVTGKEFPVSYCDSKIDYQTRIRSTNDLLKSRVKRVTERMGALWDFLQGKDGADGAYDVDTSHGNDRAAQQSWTSTLLHVKAHFAEFEQTMVRRGFIKILIDPPNMPPQYG